MKLSIKILSASLFSFLAIIGMYHFLSSRAFTEHISNVFHQQAENRLFGMEEDLNQILQTSESHLQLLATINPPHEENLIASKSTLQGFLQSEESFFRISAVNVNGKEWLRVNKFPTSHDKEKLHNLFADPIYQRPMLELSTFYGNVNINDDFSLPFIDISMPIKDRKTGEVSGIIWGKLSFQEIQTILERNLPPKGKVMLVESAQQRILIQADDTRTDFTKVEIKVIQQIFRNKESQGWLIEDSGDEDATFIYRKFVLHDLAFMLLYYQPNNAIYFLSERLKTYNIYVTLAGIFLFVLISLLLIKRIITPLTSITAQLSELGRKYRAKENKELTSSWEKNGDEVVQLNIAFMLFQKRLFAYSQEIETFNRTLEQQVAEKTQKLGDLNLALEHSNENLLFDITKRKRVERELESHKQNLEKIVNQRTSELSKTNKVLQKEIVERRNAEKALAEEKERLAITLRSIGDGVITTDVRGAIVLLNKVAEELTGWRQAEAFGIRLCQVFTTIDSKTREPNLNPFEEIFVSGKVQKACEHNCLIAKDGTEKIIDECGAPIFDQNNCVIGVVLVFRDVSKRVKMEEELSKARKLESVGILAGGIAHDFNNILTAVIGNLSLANLLIDPQEKKVHKLLSETEKASLRAKELTNQLLTFSKGGNPIKKIASIAEVIKDSANFVLRGSHIRCDYHLPEDTWPVEIDTGQMSQVVQNIIINARQAMPKKGVITIHCANWLMKKGHDKPLKPGKYVMFSIEDNGVGISPQVIDNIFDPYYTTKPDGSGLGLAITHSIITKHEGFITVESKEGIGTKFVIYLPATDKKNSAYAQKAPPSLEIMCKGTLLIMDDEESVRNIVMEMASHFGFETFQALDGTEALKIYQQNMGTDKAIDLVIMDLTIPGGMGGQETIKQLLQIDPTAKVVVSSGYHDEPVMSDYQSYGFIGALNKPFEINQLKGMIHKTLNNR